MAKKQTKFPRRMVKKTQIETPDNGLKGHKDGLCNRTACQKPLKGEVQYFMKDMTTTDGRLYYCGKCAHQFTYWDHIDRPNQPMRCTIDETTL